VATIAIAVAVVAAVVAVAVGAAIAEAMGPVAIAVAVAAAVIAVAVAAAIRNAVGAVAVAVAVAIAASIGSSRREQDGESRGGSQNLLHDIPFLHADKRQASRRMSVETARRPTYQ